MLLHLHLVHKKKFYFKYDYSLLLKTFLKRFFLMIFWLSLLIISLKSKGIYLEGNVEVYSLWNFCNNILDFSISYIRRRRKYWNRENFQLLIFDAFTFWDVLNTISQFLQMSLWLSVCDTNFVDTLAQKLMDGIAWLFIFKCVLRLFLNQIANFGRYFRAQFFP